MQGLLSESGTQHLFQTLRHLDQYQIWTKLPPLALEAIYVLISYSFVKSYFAYLILGQNVSPCWNVTPCFRTLVVWEVFGAPVFLDLFSYSNSEECLP